MYKVQYGCYEWQDEQTFETEQKADDFIEKVCDGKCVLGLYTADYAILEIIKEEEVMKSNDDDSQKES